MNIQEAFKEIEVAINSLNAFQKELLQRSMAHSIALSAISRMIADIDSNTYDEHANKAIMLADMLEEKRIDENDDVEGVSSLRKEIRKIFDLLSEDRII